MLVCGRQIRLLANSFAAAKCIYLHFTLKYNELLRVTIRSHICTSSHFLMVKFRILSNHFTVWNWVNDSKATACFWLHNRKIALLKSRYTMLSAVQMTTKLRYKVYLRQNCGQTKLRFEWLCFWIVTVIPSHRVLVAVNSFTFFLKFPTPKQRKELDMSRYHQNMAAVIVPEIEFYKDHQVGKLWKTCRLWNMCIWLVNPFVKLYTA